MAYSRNAVLPNGFLTLFKTNDQGVLQKTFSIIDSARTIFPSNHISLEKTLDSNFITVYSKNIVGSTRENGLIKFDSNLDTIWTRVPRQDNFQRLFYQVKPTSDNGYIIVGHLLAIFA